MHQLFCLILYILSFCCCPPSLDLISPFANIASLMSAPRRSTFSTRMPSSSTITSSCGFPTGFASVIPAHPV